MVDWAAIYERADDMTLEMLERRAAKRCQDKLSHAEQQSTVDWMAIYESADDSWSEMLERRAAQRRAQQLLSSKDTNSTTTTLKEDKP